MKKTPYILVKLKNNCGCYLTVSETKDLIDILKKEVDKSWEQQEEDKKTHDYLSHFEKPNRQFPDELFLPKSKL